jgi:hypothetical protein
MSNAIDYAKIHSRSCNAVICVYDEAGNMIEMHKHIGDSKSGKCDSALCCPFTHYSLDGATNRSQDAI